jgi:hypothetical protein
MNQPTNFQQKTADRSGADSSDASRTHRSTRTDVQKRFGEARQAVLSSIEHLSGKELDVVQERSATCENACVLECFVDVRKKQGLACGSCSG